MTNHGIAFTASADLNKAGMKGFIPDATGAVQVKFADGTTIVIAAIIGTQYSLNFDAILAAGTAVAGNALY
jgi:hypothetical protein